MQKIVPHLWFDTEAIEAANFYVSVFKNSSIISSSSLTGTPSGKVDMVSLNISGYQMMFLSAGPYFKINPSISFMYSCETAKEVEDLWGKLIVGGTALMELGTYDFSQKYGWVLDKFGVSWQIMLAAAKPIRQVINPSLMFIGSNCGKTEEAVHFYASVFKNSRVGEMARYEGTEGPDKQGSVKYAPFSLEGQAFTAMDSAYDHKFALNEAVSFMVYCKDQKELDYYWDKLSAVPESEQCGWLKDKYGVSWQIVPSIMDEMMRAGDAEKTGRVTEAFLKMKKFDIAALVKAYEGS
ncbi:VOC family protein [Treponema sp.]